MPSESELIAKAKRAALAFGMSPGEADSTVRQVAASGGRFSNPSAGRDAALAAESQKQRDLKRLEALINEAKNSNDWKVKGSYPAKIGSTMVMRSTYHLPDIVITTLRDEATIRINIAYNARVRVAQLMAQPK